MAQVWKDRQRFYLDEPPTWHERYTVEDGTEKAFIQHMEEYYSLLGPALDRKEYESLCKIHSVEPQKDSSLDTYGMKFGDFGMSHYHTNPDNWEAGIANTIHQRRYRAIKKYIASQSDYPEPDYPAGKRLDCGHTAYYQIHVMSASRGTSCEECYDRMSE